MDVKEPTAFALEALFERVVRHGIIVIDDDLEVDKEKELEERNAYLEEARSQDAAD